MSTMMRPYFRRRDSSRPENVTSFTPAQVAALYGFPSLTRPVTSDVPIALIELGGGYNPAAIAQLFAEWGLPAPVLTPISVDGATNAYTGDPQSADVEVELDICVAAACYSYATGNAAQVKVFFAPNSSQGFIDAIAAVGLSDCVACGISWGGPEDAWGTADVSSMNAAITAATQVGCVICCAAGDNGSGDGEPGDHADCPGSCDDAICCGGSTITISQDGMSIASEVVWDDNGGASGGGYSAMIAPPTWQAGILPAGKKRGVPDLNGWDTPFGPVGGTSAVAPFMAAFFAVVSLVQGKRLTGVAQTLYAQSAACFRYVAGTDGDFVASPGEWNPASGLGAPFLSSLSDVLRGQLVATPPVSAPTPGPTPPVSPPFPVLQTGITLAAAQGAAVGAFNAVWQDEHPVKRQNVVEAIRKALASIGPWAT